MTAASHELVTRFRAARTDAGLAVLEGFHAVKHALRFGAVIESAVTCDRTGVERLAATLAPDVSASLTTLLQHVPADIFAKLTPLPPATGIVALARRPAPDPAPLLADPTGPPLVLLENPSDLGNIGAVVRVAAAAGAAGVVTTGRHDPWHPAALRGSAGLHFALPVASLPGLPTTPRPVLALHPDGERLETAADPARCAAGVRHGAHRAQPGPARPCRPACHHPDAPGRLQPQSRHRGRRDPLRVATRAARAISRGDRVFAFAVLHCSAS